MKRLSKIAATMAMLGLLVAGCGGGGGGGATSGGGGGSGTVTAVDTTSPVVLHTSPANNDSGVGTNSRITVTFSEAMDSASVTASSIVLVDTTATPPAPVAATVVSYDQANRIATLSAPLLEGSHLYSAKVTTSVKDQAGNTVATDYTWTFTTSAGVDVTPPLLVSRAPAADAQDVVADTSVAMSFDKPMDLPSIQGAFFLKESANGSEVAGAFSSVGAAMVFTPSTTLKPGTNYTATLTTAATDLAGTPLTASVSWRFTTGAGSDTAPPAVLSVTPAPGATNVSRSTSLSAAFNEPIYPQLFGTINGVATRVVFDYATNTITMTPTAQLTPGTYTVSVRVKDLSGNVMSAPYQWSFTTVN